MKKMIALLLLMVILSMSAASAQPAFPALDDFETVFEVNVILSGSGHYITANNITVDSGGYANVYNINFSDTLGMLITVPLETNKISEVLLLYVGDGTTESALDFMYGIGELALTTGAIDTLDQTWDFIGSLGILENLEDGDANSITIGNLEYSYMMYTSLGIFFYITKVE